MPGFVLHVGAVVTCGHGGQATPMAPMPRVKVSGQPVATIVPLYAVASCPFATPCVTAQWTVGSVRVKTMGQPLAIQTGVAATAPNGVPLLASVVQPRVSAT
jgi:hypothetical protein